MQLRPTVREAREDEIDAVWAATDLAFHRGATDRDTERRRAGVNRPTVYVADVEGQVVGTAGAWNWPLSVPGGDLPCAAVTIVTVLPTHRRRGVLRSMMEHVAADARRRGEPLAALWASEGAIYGRFGYGPATWVRDERIDLRRSLALRAPADEPLDVRLLTAGEAFPVVAPIHERARRERGGLMRRPDTWWTARILSDDPEDRGGASPMRVAVAGGDGYALYRVREGEETNPVAAHTTVEVQELVAATATAERTLLTFLSRIDLAHELVLRYRPVDDGLAHAPVDARAVARLQEHDALWLRILDLPAAVAGRAWAAPADLVLDVEHPEDELVAGRWALRVGPDGASAERTDRPADLRLHARELGSAYLGGVRVTALRDAGLIEEHTAGACVALDAALAVERAPWTTGVF
jgi:predicted acetyltransferase